MACEKPANTPLVGLEMTARATATAHVTAATVLFSTKFLRVKVGSKVVNYFTMDSLFSPHERTTHITPCWASAATGQFAWQLATPKLLLPAPARYRHR